MDCTSTEHQIWKQRATLYLEHAKMGLQAGAVKIKAGRARLDLLAARAEAAGFTKELPLVKALEADLNKIASGIPLPPLPNLPMLDLPIANITSAPPQS